MGQGYNINLRLILLPWVGWSGVGLEYKLTSNSIPLVGWSGAGLEYKFTSNITTLGRVEWGRFRI